MVANTAPIFPDTPNVSWGTVITAANTTKDLTSGTITLIFTAGADGAFINSIVGQPHGTNVASLARVFINNGSATGTAANNTYYGQIGLPAITNSESAEVPNVNFPMNIGLPPGYTIYITLATAVAAGWQFTAVGGDY